MKYLTRMIFFLAFTLVLLFSAAAYGQDTLNYLSFKGGAFFPDNQDFEDSFTAEVTVEHYFNPNLAIEGGLGYVGIGDFDGTVNTPFGPIKADVDSWAVPITFTAKGILPINNIKLYAGAGFGLYVLEARATFSFLGFPASDDDDEVVWGGHLLAGLQVDVSPQILLGLEGKYTSTDNVSLHVANTSLEVEVEGFSATGVIGFRF